MLATDKFSRLPFTLIMLAILIGMGVYGQTHVGPLDADVHHEVSFSPKLLLEGGAHRLITSLFFTAGGWMFYVSLAMFAMIVGWTEWLHGTRLATAIFWGVHLWTLLIVALVISLPLAALGSMHGDLLYRIRDVGPSAGYYGCLGFAIGGLGNYRRGLVVAISLILLARLIWSASQLPDSGSNYTADLSHVIAFWSGKLFSQVVSQRQKKI